MEMGTSYVCPSCGKANLVLAENPIFLTLYCPRCGAHSSISKRSVIRGYVDYENGVFRWREVMGYIYASIATIGQKG
ncbi:hypothetical protein GCM10007981_14580 [Thermocladium modestius]|uniref:Uncharacterized protein n=1 Tax=Thermocladium modestius TaxID=62609 RepID=A0A830GWV2_9CREN|nr:hypothetical protein [Thermocladium modestius]GGP21702.1 hypothetical protein GCM10007981_14580 [Thermocladium modestius]